MSSSPFTEDDLLPISALQHVVFCERQFALIHLERLWLENQFTAEGREMHERVDAGGSEVKQGTRVGRALALRSLALGLIGKADVVEFRADPVGVEVRGWRGRWRPFPVEYKRGKPKEHRADEIQLCAQACCLEEMLGIEVPRGALFYGKTRRRTEVEFDASLRDLVAGAASRAREILRSGVTPPSRREKKCDHCSLLEVCRPDSCGRSAARYLERSLEEELARTEAPDS